MGFIKKNSWIIFAAIGGIILFIITATSATPEGDLADTRDKNHVDYITQGDIEKKEISESDKTNLEKWKISGFLVNMDRFSHEIWVDEDIWNSLSEKEQKERIITFSNYYKDFDGTSQVVVFRSKGDKTTLAEYIAGEFRFHQH
ncbi:MAG: hypothetical protein JXR70_02920 [Spirochaetales bacterium]|nr:hypothetical protein [Spirochaetales bacterium]